MRSVNECRICGGPGSSRWSNEGEIAQAGSWVKPEGEVSTCKYCGGQIFLQGTLGPQLEIERIERTTRLSDTPFKMACLLHERVLKGLGDCPIGFRMARPGDSTDGEYGALHVYDKWIDAFPQTPLEHIDRALLNIYRHISWKRGFFTEKYPIAITLADSDRDKPIIDCAAPFRWRTLFCHPKQADALVNMMASMEYVQYERMRDPCGDGFEPSFISLEPKGLQRITDLQAGQSETSDTCFVAMAYHKKTDAFRDAVRSAIKQAGFHVDPITVDEEQHNDFIMDRVINMIDDARFIIADLTVLPESPPERGGDKAEKAGKAKNGVRGGVYWEAGYARGRGKEVIYTCNADDNISENRIHFDIEQIARLRWKKDQLGEFTRALATRIVATVGKGPNYKG